LFGYEKGAFTGAYANKQGRVELAHLGSLFLDEVGSLDLSVQAKLLQVLQDGSFMRVGAQESRSVNTRLISAATGNLRDQTNDGTFRLDFFFRINAVTIELPRCASGSKTCRNSSIISLIYTLKPFAQPKTALPRDLRLMQRPTGRAISVNSKHDSQLHRS